jgi:hypothetical protein
MASPYFTLNKARRLVVLSFDKLSNRELQSKIVMLRDYKRYISHPSLYMDVLVKGGYYGRVCDPSASGLVPVDIWLCVNIRHALDDATKEMRRRE